MFALFFFFSSRRRHTRLQGDWSSDVCSSDLHNRRREVNAQEPRQTTPGLKKRAGEQRRLLSGAQNLGDGGGELAPGAFFAFELFAACGGEVVILGAAIVFGGAPAGFDPAATFEAMQRGIEGALLNLQNVLGGLLDALGDGPAVLRLESKGFEDEEIEGALGEIEFFGRHAVTPCASTGGGYRGCCGRARGDVVALRALFTCRERTC